MPSAAQLAARPASATRRTLLAAILLVTAVASSAASPPVADSAPVAATGRTVTVADAFGTAEAERRYREFIQGPQGTGLRIVESLCQARRGGRICPVSSDRATDAEGAEQAGEPVRTWYFVPPLPPAGTPEGRPLGAPEEGEERVTDWMVPIGFVADGAARLAEWRRNAEQDLVVDCSFAGCGLFAFVESPARPAEETWLAKCWVEVASGVLGAPYGCRQVAAWKAEVVWMRALMTWERSGDERPPRPPFRPVAICDRELADPLAVAAEVVAASPHGMTVRTLPRGRGLVAVAAPRPSAIAGDLLEWPSARLEVVLARQSRPAAPGAEPAWAYALEVTARLAVAPAQGEPPAWREATDEERVRWIEPLRARVAARLAAACGEP